MPEPLTPVTQVSVFSGIVMSMSFRLCSVAPSSRSLLSRAAPPRRRHRNRQFLTQILRRQRPRLAHQAVERAREHHAAALLAGAEAEIHDVIGDLDHVGVVLDDETVLP